MRRLALLGTLSLAAACLDFDGLRDKCRQGQAPCDDAGTVGGGAGGGGGSAGGGTAGGGTAGGTGGGAMPGDGGQGPICFNGFCWENPLPQGNDLGAVWGTTPDDVWAGGAGNMLLHWDGAAWSSSQLPSQNDPRAQVTALLGVGSDFYAALATGPLQRWSGAQWMMDGPTAPVQVNTLSGTRPDDVWAGKESGDIQRRGATGWSTVVPGSAPNLGAIASDGNGGVWYERELGSVVFPFSHYPPGEELVTFGFGVTAVWQLSDATVHVTIGDGSTFRVSADGGFADAGGTGILPRGTHLRPDGTGFAVGGSLEVAATADGGWVHVSTDTPPEYDSALALDNVWTAPAVTGSWAVGQAGVMLRYDGANFRLYRQGIIDTFEGLAENGGTIVGVGGSGYIVLRNPADGSWFKGLPFSDSTNKYAVCALPDGGFVFGGGAGKVYFWRDTGGGLPPSTHVPDDSEVRGLACLPSGTVLASTSAGGIFRYESLGWKYELDAGSSVLDLDGFDDEHVWAAGNGAYYTRRPDGGWQTQTVGADLHAVRADPDAGHVWFGGWFNGGEYSGVLAMDGGGISDMPFASTTGGVIHDIQGTEPDLWAGSETGVLYRWSGSQWEPQETGSRQGIATLLVRNSADGGHDLWVGGDRGLLLHRSY